MDIRVDVETNVKGTIRAHDSHVADIYPSPLIHHRQVATRLGAPQWKSITLVEHVLDIQIIACLWLGWTRWVYTKQTKPLAMYLMILT